MKVLITEEEKNDIISLYQKKNLLKEFNLPFLKQKVKTPFFIVKEDPTYKGKFRLYISDKDNPGFTPVDAEKLLGKGEWKYYDNQEQAQQDADKQNNTVSGKAFENDKFLNLPPEMKEYQKDLKKRGYLDIVDKVGLPDGTYFAEGFRPCDMCASYDPQEPKAQVNRNSKAYKIKTEGKPEHKYDTGYVVLTSVLGGDVLPGVGTVSIKGGMPNSSHWGNQERIISIHKNPSIVK